MIEQQRDDAQGDARDVLRLVDIMSASPAGIKSVLEAYLKQLGGVFNVLGSCFPRGLLTNLLC